MVARFEEHFKLNKVVYRHYSGEVENIYITFAPNLFKKLYQILLESPKFYRRYYKKHLSLFFWTHCI